MLEHHTAGGDHRRVEEIPDHDVIDPSAASLCPVHEGALVTAQEEVDEVDAYHDETVSPEAVTLTAEGDKPATSVKPEHQRAYEHNLRVISRRGAYLEAQIPIAIAAAEHQAARFREMYGAEPDPKKFDGMPRLYKNALRRVEGQLEFLRPPTDEDIAYREQVRRVLPSAIAEAAPPGLPLRFHGTPLYVARDILASGEVSSSVDRLGVSTSYDGAGAISATGPDEVSVVVSTYMGLSDNDACLPPGVMFVMLPESAMDAAAGQSLLMSNVEFRDHPERLFAIAASHEGLPVVREWAAASGVDPEKVFEYFAFTDELRNLGDQIAAGTVQLQDLVPYPL